MKLTQLISIILHPIFIPLLALHLTLLVLPSLSLTLTQNMLLIYGILILSTIVLPLMSVFWLIQKGKVSSLEMSNHKERKSERRHPSYPETSERHTPMPPRSSLP